MGGCYERSAVYAHRESRCTQDRSGSEARIRKFFSSGKPELLIAALLAYESEGRKTGFFKCLMDYQRQSEAEREQKDYEIESKLEICLTPLDGQEEPTLTDILDALEFPPTKGARFIKDPVNVQSTGENSFFGDDNDERFVVISKGGNWYLKEKGKAEHYSFGIPGEQLVMKRRETRAPTDPLKVAETIMSKYADGTTSYKGAIRKEKADMYLLNTTTGRMYGVTASDARCGERRQLQLEVEYAGFIKGFATDTENERSIVEDIAAINRHILLMHNGASIKSWRINFLPTSERKFDFVAGKKRKEIPAEQYADEFAGFLRTAQAVSLKAVARK
jgi:hypothetical protein